MKVRRAKTILNNVDAWYNRDYLRGKVCEIIKRAGDYYSVTHPKTKKEGYYLHKNDCVFVDSDLKPIAEATNETV